MFFLNCWVLFFSPLLIFSLYKAKKSKKDLGFKFSSGELVKNLKPSLKIRLCNALAYLKYLAFLLILLAIARPQSPVKGSKINIEGVDIVLTIDCSSSMLSEDFKIKEKRVNRIEVVKKVVYDFIEARESDRIALVVFGGRPYTVSPLTLDHNWLLKNLDRVQVGMLEDNTAIGLAISSSLSRLKKSNAKTKIIILLTDGRNNAGEVSPDAATELAMATGVKIYTIGAGTEGAVPCPVTDESGNIIGYRSIRMDIDESMLKRIAQKTNAKYYRATDFDSLKNIYREIDKLEKSPIVGKQHSQYNELFTIFLAAALFILISEFILTNTIFRRIP